MTMVSFPLGGWYGAVSMGLERLADLAQQAVTSITTGDHAAFDSALERTEIRPTMRAVAFEQLVTGFGIAYPLALDALKVRSALERHSQRETWLAYGLIHRERPASQPLSWGSSCLPPQLLALSKQKGWGPALAIWESLTQNPAHLRDCIDRINVDSRDMALHTIVAALLESNFDDAVKSRLLEDLIGKFLFSVPGLKIADLWVPLFRDENLSVLGRLAGFIRSDWGEEIRNLIFKP